MAGNNQIQLLRGSKSNSNGKDTISDALTTLLPGQPLYSKDENYLYIRGNESEEATPVTTDRIKKGNSYVQIEADGDIKMSPSRTDDTDGNLLASVNVYGNANIRDAVVANKLFSLDKSAKGSIVVNAQIDGTSNTFPNIQIASMEDNKIKDAMIYGQNGIVPNNTSASFLGTDKLPFYKVNAKNISAENINASSNVNALQTVCKRVVSDKIVPSVEGYDKHIGSSDRKYDSIYVTNIYSDTIDTINNRLSGNVFTISSSTNGAYGTMCTIGDVFIVDATLPGNTSNITSIRFDTGADWFAGKTIKMQGSIQGFDLNLGITATSKDIGDAGIIYSVSNPNDYYGSIVMSTVLGDFGVTVKGVNNKSAPSTTVKLFIKILPKKT